MVAGRVSDTAGRPVATATVAVIGPPNARRLAATTADDGQYEVAGVPTGTWQVRVTRLGYVPQTLDVTIRPGARATADFTLVALPTELSRVVVTERDEAARIRESPFSVTVIEGARLAGRGLTLDEALQRATGVQVRRSGGLGSASVFHVRGLEGQRVQIYVDGNAADVAGNAFTLDDLPLQLIERIEIYKGVVPARFGGDGLGAAINIVLIHPEGGYADVGYTAGSYGQQQVSATAQRPLGRGLELAATLNLDRADNDYIMESPFLPGVRIERDHDGFRRLLGAAVFSTGRAWFDELELVGALIGSQREIQGIQTNVQHAETHSRLLALELQGDRKGALGGRLDLRSALIALTARSSLIDTSATRYTFEGEPYASPNGRGELGLLPSDSDNRTELFRHRTAATYRFGDAHIGNLTYVVDVSRYRPRDGLANSYAGRNVSEFPGEQTSAVIGLSHEWRPLGDRLVNVLGTRGYLFRAKGTPSSISDPSAERPPPVTNRTVSFGASEAVRYFVSATVLAKASVELARRLPTTAELFGDGLLVQASPTLRPERSLNVNVGLQYDRALGDGRHLQAETNAFWMNLRDMIRLTQGFAGLAAYTNLGAARIAGADAEVRADVTRWLHASANLTYQDARDVLTLTPGTTVPSPTHRLRLPNLPWLFGTATLELHGGGLLGVRQESRLFYEGSFTEEYFYGFELSRRQERRIPRAIVHTLGAEHRWLASGLTVSAEVQNLFDIPVFNQFNYPLPGRVFRAKLRYTRIGRGDDRGVLESPTNER